tara:strand:- start:1505 stop:2185 length:681 start_codon:yes stop_codon:yes gene_type:complete
LLNTFSLNKKINLINEEKELIASLQSIPVIAVLRPEISELENYSSEIKIFQVAEQLYKNGLIHIEIAWSNHPNWKLLINDLRSNFLNIKLGVASIKNIASLNSVVELGLNYAMSPFIDENLQKHAIDLDFILIPGVLSPTEINLAIQTECQLIKLFPASVLGINYLNHLKDPFNSLPFAIAAGGLSPKDIKPWLDNGYGAIAMGRKIISNSKIDKELINYLKVMKN